MWESCGTTTSANQDARPVIVRSLGPMRPGRDRQAFAMVRQAGERPSAAERYALAQCAKVGTAVSTHHHRLLARCRWGSCWRGRCTVLWCHGWGCRASATDSADGGLTARRKAAQIALEALQGGRAAGRNGGTVALIIGRARLADRIGLRLCRLLGNRAAASASAARVRSAISSVPSRPALRLRRARCFSPEPPGYPQRRTAARTAGSLRLVRSGP